MSSLESKLSLAETRAQSLAGISRKPIADIIAGPASVAMWRQKNEAGPKARNPHGSKKARLELEKIRSDLINNPDITAVLSLALMTWLALGRLEKIPGGKPVVQISSSTTKRAFEEDVIFEIKPPVLRPATLSRIMREAMTGQSSTLKMEDGDILSALPTANPIPLPKGVTCQLSQMAVSFKKVTEITHRRISGGDLKLFNFLVKIGAFSPSSCPETIFHPRFVFGFPFARCDFIVTKGRALRIDDTFTPGGFEKIALAQRIFPNSEILDWDALVQGLIELIGPFHQEGKTVAVSLSRLGLRQKRRLWEEISAKVSQKAGIMIQPVTSLEELSSLSGKRTSVLIDLTPFWEWQLTTPVLRRLAEEGTTIVASPAVDALSDKSLLTIAANSDLSQSLLGENFEIPTPPSLLVHLTPGKIEKITGVNSLGNPILNSLLTTPLEWNVKEGKSLICKPVGGGRGKGIIIGSFEHIKRSGMEGFYVLQKLVSGVQFPIEVDNHTIGHRRLRWHLWLNSRFEPIGVDSLCQIDQASRDNVLIHGSSDSVIIPFVIPKL